MRISPTIYTAMLAMAPSLTRGFSDSLAVDQSHVAPAPNTTIISNDSIINPTMTTSSTLPTTTPLELTLPVHPGPRSEHENPVCWHKAEKPARLCGASPRTSENRTTIHSPFVGDCIALSQGLRDRPGHFQVRNHNTANTGALHAIAKAGTCTLGLRPAAGDEEAEEWHWAVGNVDAAEILEKATREHAAAAAGDGDGSVSVVKGRIGASGAMWCVLGGEQVPVAWSIYGVGEVDEVEDSEPPSPPPVAAADGNALTVVLAPFIPLLVVAAFLG